MDWKAKYRNMGLSGDVAAWSRMTVWAFSAKMNVEYVPLYAVTLLTFPSMKEYPFERWTGQRGNSVSADKPNKNTTEKEDNTNHMGEVVFLSHKVTGVRVKATLQGNFRVRVEPKMPGETETEITTTIITPHANQVQILAVVGVIDAVVIDDEHLVDREDLVALVTVITVMIQNHINLTNQNTK